MRISRRTSGGRGEYEISEEANGLKPTDLLAKELVFDLGGGWRFDTGTTLTSQGGKRRIRRRAGDDVDMQVQRQFTAALLMPHSVRADEALGRGVPMLRANKYAIDHIELGSARIRGDVATLRPATVTLRNLSHHAEELSVAERVEQVRFLWENADQLPEPVPSLLREHQALVTNGDPISREAEEIVENIQNALTEQSTDFGITYRSKGEDVVPHLLRALEWAEEPPEPPVDVEEIDPEEQEIKRRTVKDWKRWANSRGAASAKFRQAVRRAYNSTCIVCGLHLPGTEHNAAGVDAAHILPWAKYELDHVSNGLCLCRNHHWAFDEGLLVIRFDGTHYHVEMPEDAARLLQRADADFSVRELIECCGPIPDARLPAARTQRPSQRFLDELRENS